jgi:hypothetical protein
VIPEKQDNIKTCEQRALQVVQAGSHFWRKYVGLRNSRARQKIPALKLRIHTEAETRRWLLDYEYQ